MELYQNLPARERSKRSELVKLINLAAIFNGNVSINPSNQADSVMVKVTLGENHNNGTTFHVFESTVDRRLFFEDVWLIDIMGQIRENMAFNSYLD